jgi:hypothetical protein
VHSFAGGGLQAWFANTNKDSSCEWIHICWASRDTKGVLCVCVHRGQFAGAVCKHNEDISSLCEPCGHADANKHMGG